MQHAEECSELIRFAEAVKLLYVDQTQSQMIPVQAAHHAVLVNSSTRQLENATDPHVEFDQPFKKMVLVLDAKTIASLIPRDSISVVKEHVYQDNALETSISQDLVNMHHVEECKKLIRVAEAVNLSYVDQTQSQMILVQAAHHAILVNWLTEQLWNATNPHARLDQLFKQMVLVLNAQTIASLTIRVWTNVVQHVWLDNAKETTSTSQDLVHMQHAEECKQLIGIAEAVQLLYVHQTLSKTILVQDVLYAVPTANASLKLEVNVKISSVQ